jgi:hypothetical protein
MNKLLTTITLLCFSVAANAQDQEVWACQQEESAGLFWENNRWVSSGVIAETLLITIPTAPPRHIRNEITDNRNNGTYKRGDAQDRGMFCRTNTSETVSCISGAGNNFFLLDRETGRLGFAALVGALSMGSNYRDSVSSKIYNCTKF